MARKTIATAIGARREQSSEAQQMDLFAMRRVANVPDWTDLPKDAREALVGLMMRLILEHAQMAAPTKMEAGHDC
jgi:hypothetical protein